ncbi:MAG TPA: BACON domain-containing carbohydrate-binding protein [Blastocatellia bacterium]|nr:BACON domain-containing carbohydrate-binding protein [Blastocatellia bacterium]
MRKESRSTRTGVAAQSVAARSRVRALMIITIVAIATAAVLLSSSPNVRTVRAAGEKTQQGALVMATDSAVVSFDEVARLEALNPTTPAEPTKTNPPKPIPDDLPMPAIAPKSEAPPKPAAQEAQTEPLVASPAPATTFQALTDNNTSLPPDTHGAVGPNHVMTVLNTQYRIQSRSGQTISTVPDDSFWASLNNPSAFDPKILYDPFNSRWMLTAVSNSRSAASSVLIGVSQTSDPTGNWNLFRVDADAADLVWADYPSLGFNKDWIVVQVNMFTNSSNAFSRTQVYAFRKASLYANVFGATQFSDSTIGGTQTPAITYDNTLPTMYLVSRWNSGAGALRLFTITGAVGSEVFTSTNVFPTSPEGWGNGASGDFAPQLGTPARIATNDSRIQNVVYRNGSLWCAHTAFLPFPGTVSRSSVQWWQFDAAGNIQQLGRIDDPSGLNFFGFPTIAVNKFNDVLVGYSRFSSAQYASANYAFRASTDAPNTLRDDAVLKAGEASYFKTFGGASNRWGDYSSTVVDPANDTDLWTIQQYASQPSGGFDRWATWWGRIAPSAPCATSVSSVSKFFPETGGEDTVTVTAGCSWQAVSNATWIMITSPDSGTGNGTVSYLVRDNTTGFPRTGSMTIAGITFTVTQSGGVAGCAPAISPLNAAFSAAASPTNSINITAAPACAWQAVSNAPWITITSSCCGTGNGAVTYSVAANPSPGGRRGTITVAGRVFTVKQKGA